jgi:hypothetical protein
MVKLSDDKVREHQGDIEASGYKSIRKTEIYAYLSDKYLHQVVSMLPSPNLGTVMGIPAILQKKGIAQVVENKVVGDAGFEPATSTV